MLVQSVAFLTSCARVLVGAGGAPSKEADRAISGLAAIMAFAHMFEPQEWFQVMAFYPAAYDELWKMWLDQEADLQA